jgi:hypothetical protein
MKRYGAVALMVLFIGGIMSFTPFSVAHADCSKNGYYHSGGKCGKSYWKYEHDDDKDDDDDDNDDDDDDSKGRSHRKNGYSWYTPSYSYQTDQIAYLLALIADLERALRDRHSEAGDSDIAVVTRGATNIDEDSATLKGTIDQETVDDDTDVSESIDELDDNTLYYFRIVGEDEDGDIRYGAIRSFRTDDNGSHSNDDDDTPEARTDSADTIGETSARLRGHVDMRDFENGVVFFVYGEDEDQIQDVENDFDTYDDVDEEENDLLKELVEDNLDNDDSFTDTVHDLDQNTTHYFRMCVAYEDNDNDDTVTCGSVRNFETE